MAGEVPQHSMEHWDLLMRARWHFWRTTPDHVLQAQALLDRALEINPNLDGIRRKSREGLVYASDVDWLLADLARLRHHMLTELEPA